MVYRRCLQFQPVRLASLNPVHNSKSYARSVQANTHCNTITHLGLYRGVVPQQADVPTANMKMKSMTGETVELDAAPKKIAVYEDWWKLRYGKLVMQPVRDARAACERCSCTVSELLVQPVRGACSDARAARERCSCTV
jgi:hypothetical protein